MTPGSAAALIALALAGLLLRRLLARWASDRHLHFFVLFALPVCAAPLLFRHTGLVLLPQPGRYTVEMEAALVLLAVFGLRPLLDRIRPIGRAGLCMLLIAAAITQVISHRRFAKTVLREADIAATIEYRAARWMEEHLFGARVMLPGSMSQWTNAFARQPQFSGGSFSTTPNPVLHRALSDIYLDPGHQLPLLWLKAFGAGAIAVPGPQSPRVLETVPQPRQVRRGTGSALSRRRHGHLPSSAAA